MQGNSEMFIIFALEEETTYIITGMTSKEIKGTWYYCVAVSADFA